MSSVLHPVGPEEPKTYWVRRAIVVGAVVLALIVMIAAIVSQTSSGSVVAQPTPSASDPSPPAATTPTYIPTPSATPTPTPAESTKGKAGASPSTKAKGKAKPSTKPSAPATKAAPVACPAGDLRATLTGKQRLRPEQASSFTISLINGSDASCDLDVTSDNFELKIYSGQDRIWSTDDCAKLVKTVSKKLAEEQAVEWKITWDGRRSRAECRQRPEIPKVGTYFATAQFKGAKPVQLRMVLRG